jgi:hypothetical protein
MHFVDAEIVYEEGIEFDFGKKITRTLPKAMNVSEIILIATMGALSGGSTGSVIANCAIESIRIRINGKESIVWDGADGIAGQISMGIAVLREFYYQKNGVAMPDEQYVIELPDAIPKNNDVQIIIQLSRTIASLQTSGGDRTTLAASTIAIKYKANDKIKGRVLVPYINWTTFSFAARTGNLLDYLPTLNLPLRKLMIITHDSNVLANDTFDRLTISKGDHNFTDSSIADLRRNQAQRSRKALNTGFVFVQYPAGLKVPASTLLFKFEASTAGTSKLVHIAWIAY